MSIICRRGTLSQVQGHQIIFIFKSTIFSELYECVHHLPGWLVSFSGPSFRMEHQWCQRQKSVETRTWRRARTPNHVQDSQVCICKAATFLRIGPQWCGRPSAKTFCKVQEHQLHFNTAVFCLANTPLSGKLNTYRKCVPKFPKVCFPLTKG